MYNDYYLQSIDNKLTITNNRLNELIENQETLISGDNTIIQNQYKIEEQNIMIHILLLTILLYLFIVRCFK